VISLAYSRDDVPLSMLVWQFPASRAGLENLNLLHQPSVLRRQRPVVPSCRRLTAERTLSMAELVGLISDLRALEDLHRAGVVERARVVDVSVIPARHGLRTVKARFIF
jgi:hypothetical protein